MDDGGRRAATALLAVAEFVLALPAAYFAVFSFMLFPTPESRLEPWNWFLFGVSWAVPGSLVLGAICALVAVFRARRRRWVTAALALPGAAVLLFLFSIALS